MTDQDAEIARLKALVLALADRIEKQAMLLARRAERTDGASHAQAETEAGEANQAG